MGRRVEFDVRGNTRPVVLLRRRRPAVWRLNGLLLAGIVGAGAAAGVWRLLGVTAGQATRVTYAVMVFALVVGMIRLACGGRR